MYKLTIQQYCHTQHPIRVKNIFDNPNGQRYQSHSNLEKKNCRNTIIIGITEL